MLKIFKPATEPNTVFFYTLTYLLVKCRSNNYSNNHVLALNPPLKGTTYILIFIPTFIIISPVLNLVEIIFLSRYTKVSVVTGTF